MVTPARALGVDAALILDTANEAFVAMDIDGTVVEWNRAAEQLFGWTRDEASGRELAELIIPEHLREAHRRGIARFQETGEGPVLETRIELPALHRDGHEFDVEITISAMTATDGRFFHAFLHDISERRSRERMLHTQLQITRALATADPDVAPRLVLEALCRAGGWSYGGWWVAGNHAEVLHGYQAWWDEEVADLADLESASRSASFHRGRGVPGLAWQSEEPIWRRPVEGVEGLPRSAAMRRSGMSIALAVPLLAGGEVVGVLEFLDDDARDPSEYHRALLDTIGPQIGEYVARRRAERRAGEAQDAFVAMVSHELRTPLTAISGFTQTMLDEPEIAQQRGIEFLGIIQEQTARLTRLVDELLTVSVIQSRGIVANLERMDIADAVRETLDELGQRELFELHVDRSMPLAFADRDLTKQVVVNLVANAVRYGAAPFRIDVASSMDAASVIIAVVDHGPGVPTAFEPQLFDRFTRADQVQHISGTGLGLSIVRALADAQRGRAWYERNDPTGARFLLELPCFGGPD